MKLLSKLWDFLDGKKSFIGAGIIFCAGGLKALGRIDEESFKWVVTLGGAISVYGIRDAIKKLHNYFEEF